MACSTPLAAYRHDGEIRFNGPRHLHTLELPCGQCIECLLERSRQWAIRVMNEAQLWPNNTAITLTYGDNAPSVLVYKHYQDFMKRLRRKYSHKKIRFYMGAEYGGENGRPHYHAVLFNHAFDDKKYLKQTKAGSKLYTSATLEKLWTHGYSSIGEVTFQTAAYIARYCLDKAVDRDSKQHEIINPDTGEIFTRPREFGRMSLKPGIGAAWLNKFWTDVYPHGAIVQDQLEQKPPRYYDQLFERREPEAHALLKAKRKKLARAQWRDNTKSRRAAKHQVKLAQLAQLKRNRPWNTSSSASTTEQQMHSADPSLSQAPDKQSDPSRMKSTAEIQTTK